MSTWLLLILSAVLALWVAGYVYTILELRDIPGFPIDYKMLAITWPLTAVGMVFLDPDEVMDDFMDELADLDMEVESDAEAFEDVENRDVDWQSFDELIDDTDSGSVDTDE